MTDKGGPIEGPWAKAGVILTGLGIIAAVYYGSHAPSPSSPTPTSSTSQTLSAPDPRPTTSTSLPTSEASTPVVMAASLKDLAQTATGSGSNDDVEWSDGPVMINGTSYPSALKFSCMYFCNGNPPEIYEVALGRRYTTFTAVFGPPEASNDQTYTLQVTVDQHAPRTFTGSRTSPAQISISVKNAQYLRLTFYAASAVGNPAANGAGAAGGNSPQLPDVALGNPTVFP